MNNDNQPDYRVFQVTDHFKSDIGAAWKKTSQREGGSEFSRSARIPPEIHADEPGIRPPSNDLPCLPCHEATPGRSQAHNSHTGVEKIRFYWVSLEY